MTRRGEPWVGGAGTAPHLVLLGAVLAGVALRFSGLAFDPVHPSWIGWQLDEGRWVEAAREWALFGSVPTGEASVIHLALAPFFQLVTGGVFEVFGVGFVQARLPSALAGSAVLVALALGLRGRLAPWPLAAVVLLAAFDPALLYSSRVAVPEMLSALWQLLAFVVLIRRPDSLRWTAVAGVLVLLALGTKATTAPAAVGLFATLLITHGGQGPGRVARAVTFVAAAAAPVALGAITLVWAKGSPDAMDPGRILSPILGFVELNAPLDVLGTPYFSGRGVSRGNPSAVNLLLAGVWTCGVFLFPGRLRRSAAGAERVFRGALAWGAGTFGAWALLAYFPDRWVMHVHLPLIVALGAGITALASPGSAEEEVEPAEWGPWRRAALVLPWAVILSAWMVALSGTLGLNLDRVRWHMPIMGAVTLGLAILVPRAGGRWAGAVPAAALLALLAWRISAGPLPYGTFWTGDAGSLLRWTLILLMVVPAGLAMGRRGGAGVPWHAHLARVGSAYALGLSGLWLAFHFIGRPEPTSALASVAEQLNRRYAGETEIGVENAATVMLGSPLRYRDVPRGSAPRHRVLVAMVGGGWGRPPEEEEIEGYRVTYEVALPRYEGGAAEPAGLRMYERIAGSPDGEASPGGGVVGAPGSGPDEAVVDRSDGPPQRVPDDEPVHGTHQAARPGDRVAREEVAELSQRAADLGPRRRADDQEDPRGREQPDGEGQATGDTPGPGVESGEGGS
ncbi:MAG TPA: hypothetical protein VK858_19970 [Longimicrobiales bacterium]|nr:hypothetical protein [Longimicrobiales bacterium]